MADEPSMFRAFYHAVQDTYLGRRARRPLTLDVLLDWSARLQPQMAALARYAPAAARHLRGEDIIWDLYELYALSRVSDVLSAPFQPEPAHRVPPTTLTLSLSDYEKFWESLGLTLLTPTAYHPFACEIAEVLQAPDPASPIELLELRWPGLMFGDLLIARAGAAVWAGADHARADIAPRSPLFFSYLRRYRPTIDLSMGWGHNSQWRTKFRRDYLDADRYVIVQTGVI